MNREIKFRGKSTFNNQDWVYGSFALVDDTPSIISESMTWEDGSEMSLNDWSYVHKDTVGQFTGLTDKNGKEIYEGDIVLQQGYHGKKIPMVVKFECGAFIVGYHEGSSTKRRPMLLNSQCEVIGNVFDNRDLLED